MKAGLLVLLLATLCFHASIQVNLHDILDTLRVSISKTARAEGINEQEFAKNVFLRVDLKPSLVQTILTLASMLLPIKVKDLKLPDIHLQNTEIRLNATLSKLVLKSIELGDTDNSGILPVSKRTADFILPKITANFTFDYYIDFGHDRPETGSASVSFKELRWQARLETYQGEIGKKPEGPVRILLHSNDFSFTSMTGQFSDPFTQSEWDVLLGNPIAFKKLAVAAIGALLRQSFKKFDLRLMINKAIHNTNLIIGLTEPAEYQTMDLPEPDNYAMSIKFHSIVTLQSGEIIEGLFPVDMSQDPLSTKYTSIILTTDILNRLLRAITTPKSPSFSFNQALLDKLHFNLLKLDTTSLKPFFPILQSQFGKSRGVYMKVYLPEYDSNQCYVRTNTGFLNVVLSAVLEIYVCIDPEIYKTKSLDECIAAGKCLLGLTNLMELLITLPLQLTKDKKIAPGYFDLELTHVQMTPGLAEESDTLKQKINNFLDLVLPHILPEIDISTILAPFLVSIDSMNDQRIAIGIAQDLE